jgi:ribonuclease HI
VTAPRPRPLLELWTDGAAGARAGLPGGWAFVAVAGEREVLGGQGGHPATTCVLMELEAVRQALVAVEAKGWHQRYQVVLVSDSSIALQAASGRFLPRPYAAVAAAVHALAQTLGAGVRKVRAHAGSRWNELADARAASARAEAAIEARKPARHGRR